MTGKEFLERTLGVGLGLLAQPASDVPLRRLRGERLPAGNQVEHPEQPLVRREPPECTGVLLNLFGPIRKLNGKWSGHDFSIRLRTAVGNSAKHEERKKT